MRTLHKRNIGNTEAAWMLLDGDTQLEDQLRSEYLRLRTEKYTEVRSWEQRPPVGAFELDEYDTHAQYMVILVRGVVMGGMRILRGDVPVASHFRSFGEADLYEISRFCLQSEPESKSLSASSVGAAQQTSLILGSIEANFLYAQYLGYSSLVTEMRMALYHILQRNGVLMRTWPSPRVKDGGVRFSYVLMPLCENGYQSHAASEKLTAVAAV